MRTRTLFVSALLGLGMMASCTNDELEGMENGQDPQNGKGTLTQIALSVSTSNATTRVNGNTGDEVFGEDAEYKVSDLTVVFANERGIAQQVFNNLPLKTESNDDNDDKAIRVTEPFSVSPGKYYVYVLANYKGCKNALSPIIANQTDMKQIFNISDASALAKIETGTSNFLMTNSVAPTETTIATNSATTTEKDDAGEDETENPETVQLLTIDIERVVAKVTFESQNTTIFKVKEGETEVADVTLDGAGLINLNQKMYLVKGSEKAINKPVQSDWAYPKDPNYDKVLTGADGESNWLKENFSQSEVQNFSTGFTNVKFYCPENTMTAQAQQNGQTTGVVYKATWTPAATAYTELASSKGTGTLDKRYEAVLALKDKNAAITDAIFKKDESDSSTDFYTYNDLIFVSYNAACLYKAIAEFSGQETSMASTINTNFGTYSGKTTDDDREALGIYKYTAGACYYPVWIKHNPESKTAMEQGRYGVVRNHWYDLTVTKISKLGYNKPTYEDPKDPDDPEEVRIQVEAKIKKWILVKQNVEL